MTSRTPRRHRRLALMAAGTAAAMVLLPGAASAQAVPTMQHFAGAPGDPAVPGVPGDAPTAPSTPNGPVLPASPLPDPLGKLVDDLGGSQGAPSPTGADDDVVHRDDTPDSDHLEDPEPPDHASGAVGDIDLTEEDILDITKYDATIEDDGETHADSTVLGLGGDSIVGSSASSEGNEKDGDNLNVVCELTGGAICLNLLYHDVVATEDDDSSLAAARGGVLALCLGGDEDVTATYECEGPLSLGVAEGLGVAERDKKAGHTKAESANELLNLCIGKRESLTESCDGLGLQAVHSDSDSESKEPDTRRGSYLLGIDSDGESSYLLDEPEAITLLDDCGDSAILCLFLNQGKSVIFKNPQGAGSVQEMLRLDVLNRTLLVVLGQAETLAHETEGRDHHKKLPQCEDKIDNDGDGRIDFPDDKGCDSPQDDSEAGEGDGKGDNGGGKGDGGGLADTGADVLPLLAGGFLLTGMGALTVAATRRRAGKHTM